MLYRLSYTRMKVTIASPARFATGLAAVVDAAEPFMAIAMRLRAPGWRSAWPAETSGATARNPNKPSGFPSSTGGYVLEGRGTDGMGGTLRNLWLSQLDDRRINNRGTSLVIRLDTPFRNL